MIKKVGTLVLWGAFYGIFIGILVAEKLKKFLQEEKT